MPEIAQIRDKTEERTIGMLLVLQEEIEIKLALVSQEEIRIKVQVVLVLLMAVVVEVAVSIVAALIIGKQIVQWQRARSREYRNNNPQSWLATPV